MDHPNNGGMIQVVFIEHLSGTHIGESLQTLQDLPDNFTIDTTLQLGEEDWAVIEANPPTKAEFSQTGKLSLRIQQVELMDPNDIIMTLPTISNELPGLVESQQDSPIVTIHEDDWRQFEFVERSAIPQIEAELEAIQNIYDTHGIPPTEDRSFWGFRDLHIRKAIPQPLFNSQITKSQVNNLLAGWQQGLIGFERYQGVVENGYAFISGDTGFYGLHNNGELEVLAASDPITLESDKAAALAASLDLVRVDWVNAKLLN